MYIPKGLLLSRRLIYVTHDQLSITLSLGMGYYPETARGRIFPTVLIISGAGITLYVLIEIIESILEGKLSKAFSKAWASCKGE
jgi:hypothetical protein